MKGYLFKYSLPVKKFASDLGISASYLYQLLRKERKPSLELALRIEQYTKGEVSVKELLKEESSQEVITNMAFLRDNQELTNKLIERKLGPIEKCLERFEKRLKSLENRIFHNEPE